MTKEDRARFEEIDKMIARSRELRERSRSLVRQCRQQIEKTDEVKESSIDDAAREESAFERTPHVPSTQTHEVYQPDLSTSR